ncbi:YciI family protein [Actinoplanes sp. NBRC 101535]|uniref:YciI family protein n=1 Tax=Actinoplanes sp. NBRC 101535 TaxID=3032196 RepID=UPI0024A18FE6|nr:YciI family protein [Actinoplanes sp. NBRC 101535]GLY00461.1 hypothetical protein Acsp01_08400 [Actinoplanes sp. NBRC 101535]
MKFLLMVHVDESLTMGPEEAAEHLAAVGAWVGGLESRGARLTGGRLRPSGEGSTVQVRDDKLLVSDGPYAETKEQMGGFDIIDCSGAAEATEIAAGHPGARYGTVEIRPLWE